MDYHVFKAMLNRYYGRHVGGEKRPVFFDIDSYYPELGEVTRAFPAIQAEFEALMARQMDMPRYHDVDPGEKKISATIEPDKKWSVFLLEILGHRPAENRALCPRTCAAIDRVPNMIQAMFSILDPGKSVPQHEGPYLGYLRYHLALRVPSLDPPVFRIHGQDYAWKTGEAILFDDTWPHEVINHSRELRAVLMVDVLRPMPMLPRLVNQFTTNVIARHTYGRSVAKRVASHGKAA
jgi:aspartyl/asparaginyl beta-hydroxylase (cupin superfamily)